MWVLSSALQQLGFSAWKIGYPLGLMVIDGDSRDVFRTIIDDIQLPCITG